jgi:hypothetical protein
MMVHDYVDEHTLDEEEALSGAESVANELDSLEKEGDMPMEQLLAMYGYGAPHSGDPNDSFPSSESRSSSEEEILSNQDLTLDKDEIAPNLVHPDHDETSQGTTAKDLIDSVDMSSNTVRLLRCEYQRGFKRMLYFTKYFVSSKQSARQFR